MGDAATLRVTVVFALAQRQWSIPLELDAGSTVGDAVERSGLLVRLAAAQAAADSSGPLEFGVHHRRAQSGDALRDGDVVEIYRPLQIDPKEARRLRATPRKTGKRARVPQGGSR